MTSTEMEAVAVVAAEEAVRRVSGLTMLQAAQESALWDVLMGIFHDQADEFYACVAARVKTRNRNSAQPITIGGAYLF